MNRQADSLAQGLQEIAGMSLVGMDFVTDLGMDLRMDSGIGSDL